MPVNPSGHVTARIELIPDEEPESPWRTSLGSWRQYLREPTEGERMVDERILNHLRPYTDPQWEIEPDPRIHDLFKVPSFTEAETILIRALARIDELQFSPRYQWEWLQWHDDANEDSQSSGNDDRVLEPVRLFARPELPFDLLVQKSREARIIGDTHGALEFYSRAFQSYWPDIQPGAILEARDAAASLGLWTSVVLSIDLNDALHAEPFGPVGPATPLRRLQDMAAMLLRHFPRRDHGLGVRTVYPERQIVMRDFMQLASITIADLEGAQAEQVERILAMTIACFPIVALNSISRPDYADTASFNMRDYCTDLLFCLAAKVRHWDAAQGDNTATRFVQYRIAKALRCVQPYLELPLDLLNPFGAHWDLGVDAIRAFGRDKSSFESEGNSSPKWVALARVLPTVSEPGSQFLNLEMAISFAEYIDESIRTCRYDDLEDLLKALALIDFQSDITIMFGIRRFLSRPHFGCFTIQCHPRELFALENDYHSSSSKAKGEMKRLSHQSWTEAEDRNTGLTRMLGGRMDCAGFSESDQPVWGEQYHRKELRSKCERRELSQLCPIFHILLNLDIEQRHVLPPFECTVDRRGRGFWDEVFCTPTYARAIALGGSAPPHDLSVGEAKLSEEIRSLLELLEELSQWAAEHSIPRVIQANQDALAGFEKNVLQDYNMLFRDIFDLASRKISDDKEVQTLRALMLLSVAEAYVTFARTSRASDHDTILLRASGYFEATMKEGENLGDPYVTSAENLVAIQAYFWHRGLHGLRAEEVLDTCLIAEMGRRFRQVSAMRDLCWRDIDNAALPASPPQLREGSWGRLVRRSLEATANFNILRCRVTCIARKVCLSQGRDLEAWWWMQKAKADMTAGVIRQQRTIGPLVGWLLGERTGNLDRTSKIARAWAEYRPTRTTEVRFGFRGALMASGACVEMRSSLHSPKESSELEFGQFRTLVKTTSLQKSPTILGPPSLVGRLVWVEWMADAHDDIYHLCVVSMPGVPKHMDIDATKIRPSEVEEWIERFWREPRATLADPEDVSHLRALDPLLRPIDDFLMDGDILVLCPTGGLHSIPLHALHLQNERPLIACHPVAYAASYSIFEHCHSRSLLPSHSIQLKPPAVAAVYNPLDNQSAHASNFAKMQGKIRGALQTLSSALGPASFIWDTDVTTRAMVRTLQSSPLCLFVGHCVEELADLEVSRCLVLGGNERLHFASLLKLNLPSSVLVLIGCGTSEQIVVGQDEPEGFIASAMVAGATSVVGTLWSVHPVPAVKYAEILGKSLRGNKFLAGNNLIDLARAHQHAVLELRAIDSSPIAWAGYVLHGSPVMRDLWPRSGEAEVWPRFGDEGSGHTF